MTPKKAMVIVLIMFLVVAIIFVVLYVNNKPAVDQSIKQPADNGNSTSSQGNLSPAQQKIEAIETRTKEQVKQIVEQGTTASGGITAEAQRKIEAVVNQEIMEKTKLKTPEQIKADQQRQAELEKIEQQVNEQIKNQLQNR